MIDIDKLTKEDVGKCVIYSNGFKEEIGLIKSWNDKFIFVVYHCDGNWDKYQDYTGCATEGRYLTFKEKGE